MEVSRQITHLPPIPRGVGGTFGKLWTGQSWAKTFSGCCGEDKAVYTRPASRTRRVRLVASFLINQ